MLDRRFPGALTPLLFSLAVACLFPSKNVAAYDVEAATSGNTVYILLKNPNPGAVFHSISISNTPPAFVSAASATLIPATVPGARSRLAAVEFDVAAGSATGSSGDLVLAVSGIAAGQNADFDITVPLTVVNTAPLAQGVIGSTVPAADPDGIDSDVDGVVDSLETAFGSDPNDSTSTPGQASNLPGENVPALMLSSYIVLALVLFAIGAVPVVRRRKFLQPAQSTALRSPAVISILMLFVFVGVLLTASAVWAATATRIQLLASLPLLDSVPLQITGSTSVAASASSSGAAGGPGAAADGQMGTRWESQHGIDPSWLMLDLGSAYELSEVILHWEAANAASYEIQGSNDTSTWTTLASQSGGTFGDRTDNVLVSGAWRFVRMFGQTRPAGNNWGYSIFEMEVHGYSALVADSDNDGVDDSRDQCPATAPDTIVNADGCAPGVYGGYDAPTFYPGYSLVWSDEFNGSALNQADWTFEIGDGCAQGICGWGNNELQYYRSQNTNVANGVLSIEARQENFGGKNYTASRIKTQGKRFFRYGRVDIRAVLPAGTGYWPALWMLGENITSVGWPASGEIDIMEMRGNQPNKVLGTAHWQNGSGQNAYYTSDCADPNCSDNSPVLPSGTFADEFHVFSIVWTSNSISWYLDDATQPFHVISITPGELSELRGEFFFLMNIAVGGDFLPNPDDSTVFPQAMIVDYIRVYQLQ
ncbi:MAG: family 16 glycosylhydrolase [Pseudomonadales bacterium]